MTGVLLIPPLMAAILMLLRHRPLLQARVSLVGMAALVVAALQLLIDCFTVGHVVLTAGAWPVPIGIIMVADRLAAPLVLIAALIGLTAVSYARAVIDSGPETSWALHPLVHLLVWSVCGAFLTGDLFNLFVWFEIMLMSSFVLLAMDGGRAQLEGSFKYLMINLVASAIFLIGIGLLYGQLGALTLATLAQMVAAKGGIESNPILGGAAACLFTAFAIKAGLFPVFAWLPASYHTPRSMVSALLAGLLTKVGVYAMLRVFTLVFPLPGTWLGSLLLVLAWLTMIVGVLGAAVQWEAKRILAFHIISQVGYMVLALALGGAAALGGAVLYLIHHIVVKTNLFYAAGIAQARCGSDDLRQQGGLAGDRLLLAGFLISSLSLAGLPPLSGFFAKLAVVRAAVGLGDWISAGLALLVGFFTLYSMSKILLESYLRPRPSSSILLPRPPGWGWAYAPLLGLAGLTVVIGLCAGPLWVMTESVGAELLDRTAYLRAVLGSDVP